MSLPHTSESPPDVAEQQRRSDELTSRVRKLRWMGLDEEADQTQHRQSEIVPAGRVLTTPRETD